MLIRFVVIFFSFFSSSLAFANLEVHFIEGAPKDEFVITNMSSCKLTDFVLVIDLRSSKGKLFFDTSEDGLGIDVFQPFEIKRGEFVLASHSPVSDGDVKVSLTVKELAAESSIRFTVDVDDRLDNSQLGQTRVSDSEIEGAEVIFTQDKVAEFKTVLGANSKGTIALKSC